jgi:hypothetical protein
MFPGTGFPSNIFHALTRVEKTMDHISNQLHLTFCEFETQTLLFQKMTSTFFEKKKGGIEKLPFEMMIRVFKFTDLTSLANSYLVCKEWKEFIDYSSPLITTLHIVQWIHYINIQQTISRNTQQELEPYRPLITFLQSKSEDYLNEALHHGDQLGEERADEVEVFRLLSLVYNCKKEIETSKKELDAFFLTALRGVGLQGFTPELMEMVDPDLEYQDHCLANYLCNENDLSHLANIFQEFNMTQESIVEFLSRFFFNNERMLDGIITKKKCII